MADQIVKGNLPHAIPLKFKDMGDGTHAEVVYFEGGAGGGGGGSGSSDTTEATQLLVLAELQSLDTKFPSQSPSGIPVDALASLGASRSVAMGASSANVALTAATRRVSIHATVAGFFAVGTGAQTASASSHYIGAGERLDFDVAANTQIAAIRAAADGTLYISELTAP